ncbi:MAG: PH domain-containing protein [Acidobacteriota bacterium]
MPAADDSIFAITRPHPNLMTYYVIISLATLPAFPIVMLVNYFRYHTMRFRFDQEGISMSWGILFRHQTVLNYARIQDVHLRSNLIERWLGLARIDIQTASGSSSAEVTLEGLLQFEAVRDFLYSRMRGATRKHETAHADPLADTLREISAELKAIRQNIEERGRV